MVPWCMAIIFYNLGFHDPGNQQGTDEKPHRGTVWILGFTAIIARVSDIFVYTVYVYIYYLLYTVGIGIDIDENIDIDKDRDIDIEIDI